MGSFTNSKRTKTGQQFGKIETHLADKLEGAEWEMFKIRELFTVEGTKSLDSNAVEFLTEGINFVGRTFNDNGVQGKIAKQDFDPNEPFTITATVIGNYKYVKYQKEPYYCSQNINKLIPNIKIEKWNKEIAYYFVSLIQKFVSLYDGQQGGYKLEDIKNHLIELPTQNGKIDFAFMENFIAELKALRVAELHAYLQATGLSNYTLTDDEQAALNTIKTAKWQIFNVENLFGKSTRGKRLKSADRISGDLPFVTAGEADTGISAFIGNNVDRFKPNTITIDMFGSAKYRNYEYGADDHIAVVHTAHLPKHAVLFLTSAIHKVANAGQFSYARNFYAKDADALNIELPVKDGTPDFDLMENYLKAIEKLVIKDVVDWADREIATTEQVIHKS